MNKFAQNIHYQFVKGAINGAIYNYMSKIAHLIKDNENTIFDEHINKLCTFNVNTEKDCQIYFDIFANMPLFIDNLMPNKINNATKHALCTYAFINRNEYNFSLPHHYHKAILDFVNKNGILMKDAYPNNVGIDESFAGPSYNIEKWIETMRYIYDMANTNNLPLNDITEKLTSKWDKDEKFHFKNWMKYYQEGNYKKYNVKTAQFFINTPNEPSSVLDRTKDILETSPKSDPIAEKQKRLNEARKKLRSRFKSVLELLYQFRDVLSRQDNDAMRKSIYDLDDKVWNLELKASLIDSIMRTSNQFNKYGFVEGAEELKKIAQEVAQDKLPEVSLKAPATETSPAEQQATPAEEPMVPEKQVEEMPEISGVIEMPDLQDGTYVDAVAKLEEINGVIAGKNVVRALAAVDILLSSLGIAPQELSEAQVKLLEAYQYASTRISNVLSQLRGNMNAQKAKGKDKKEEESIEAKELTEDLSTPIKEVIKGPPEPVKEPLAPTAPVKTR